MGPEESTEKVKLYMMVDGQTVEIAPEIAEIKLPESQKNGDVLPMIHGRMIYRCEQCGKSWPMYLEKGIEEFGTNHKPSPFTITCPYCGGFAMDVSGIQKVPGGGYVPLPEGYGYFANVEGRDCGVPTFPPPPTVAEKAAEVGKAIEIIIDGLLREQEMELAMEAIAGY